MLWSQPHTMLCHPRMPSGTPIHGQGQHPTTGSGCHTQPVSPTHAGRPGREGGATTMPVPDHPFSPHLGNQGPVTCEETHQWQLKSPSWPQESGISRDTPPGSGECCREAWACLGHFHSSRPFVRFSAAPGELWTAAAEEGYSGLGSPQEHSNSFSWCTRSILMRGTLGAQPMCSRGPDPGYLSGEGCLGRASPALHHQNQGVISPAA